MKPHGPPLPPSAGVPTTTDVPITFTYNTANGTAIADGTSYEQDYGAIQGGGSIPAGSSFVDLPIISINDDDWVELDEQFTLVITVDDTERNIEDAIPHPTTCQINTNDGPARISIADAGAVPEPPSGFTSVYFVVSMTEKVDYAVDLTVSVAAGGTATHGTNGDFLLVTQNVTFNPGQTQKNVEVWVYHDSVPDEPEETFRLALQLVDAGGRDVDFLDSIGEGTILADN